MKLKNKFLLALMLISSSINCSEDKFERGRFKFNASSAVPFGAGIFQTEEEDELASGSISSMSSDEDEDSEEEGYPDFRISRTIKAISDSSSNTPKKTLTPIEESFIEESFDEYKSNSNSAVVCSGFFKSKASEEEDDSTSELLFFMAFSETDACPDYSNEESLKDKELKRFTMAKLDEVVSRSNSSLSSSLTPIKSGASPIAQKQCTSPSFQRQFSSPVPKVSVLAILDAKRKEENLADGFLSKYLIETTTKECWGGRAIGAKVVDVKRVDGKIVKAKKGGLRLDEWGWGVGGS